MADEAALALQPGGSPSAVAAEREAPSPPAGEPLRKKPRRDGPGVGRSPGEPGGAALERELPAAAGGCPAAAVLWRETAAGGEREAQAAAAAGEGNNGPGLQGLSREAPPADDFYDDDDDDEGEEEEEAAAAAAIGYRGPYTFVQQHLMIGTDPRTILKDLLPETIPPPELDDMTLWQIVINILSEPPKRKKRKDINTIEDAVKLLQECKKIIVLTGAGVSVSCGIPDFRSRDGIYARLAVDFPDLPDPQAMFDIEYFRKDPRPFFKFAKGRTRGIWRFPG